MSHQTQKKEIMDEVENIGSAEIATPETSQQEPVAEVVKPQESQEEKEWVRNLRRQQRELNHIVKSQQEVIEQLKAAQVAKPEPDEFDAISDAEYLDKGKIKKLVVKEAQRIAQKEAQVQAERLIKERDQSQFMDKLKRQFNDFDDVVTPESLAILEEQDPELANMIAELKDPYKIGLQSYKYIKALNLTEKVPQARREREIEKKLEKNAKTVQTPQAYDKRPMAQAFQLTDVEKKNLYSEMTKYASMSGGGY